MDVVGKTTRSRSQRTEIRIPGGGFSVLMRRVSPSSWKAAVAFPHSGRWHLVVPNWTLAGYTTPFPVDATVLVRP
jgi:hypothetical protein